MACQIFNIGRDTLYRWTRQYQMQGHVTPKARGKYVVRKLDDAVLVRYIATHPDATLEELGREFAVSGVAIWKACRRLQITRKKTMRYVERNAEVRAQVQEDLDGQEPKAVVYLHESGIKEAPHGLDAQAPGGVPIFREVSGAKT